MRIKMKRQTGSNHKNIKQQNRLLILKLVAVSQPVSRVDLAHRTGLTKMTVSNIVSGLLEQEFLEEKTASPETEGAPVQGRPPILLCIGPRSPFICGMLIKRGLCQIIMADLGGKIHDMVSHEYEGGIQAEDLFGMLLKGFHTLKSRNIREIAAVGIASVGPVNSAEGIILNPPFFYKIENVPMAERIRSATGLPVFLINDADAGALAEKLYGVGKEFSNFTYIHFMNGIGAGFVLENKLYQGDFGQCGEIGHTSISFTGPMCACGNRGCLELYASVENMRRRMRELSYLYESSRLLILEEPSWSDFVDNANSRDALALAVLDEFCGYVSHALVNLLNILNLSVIIVGYDANTEGTVLEQMLSNKISVGVLASKYKPITVLRSGFRGDAPLVGSAAAAADKIFGGELNLFQDEDTGEEGK